MEYVPVKMIRLGKNPYTVYSESSQSYQTRTEKKGEANSKRKKSKVNIPVSEDLTQS